jgi:hypothetical protein
MTEMPVQTRRPEGSSSQLPAGFSVRASLLGPAKKEAAGRCHSRGPEDRVDMGSILNRSHGPLPEEE